VSCIATTEVPRARNARRYEDLTDGEWRALDVRIGRAVHEERRRLGGERVEPQEK